MTGTLVMYCMNSQPMAHKVLNLDLNKRSWSVLTRKQVPHYFSHSTQH